jgi:quercetin dioxygenase-like cupin family protein
MNKVLSFCLVFACLLFSVAVAAPVIAADRPEQVLTQVDEILKANPIKPADKFQMVSVVQDDTTSIFVARFVEGAEVKPHLHKTHNEIVYVLKGTGSMYVNGEWIDVKPGTFHFNPMNKAHATKNTGKEELVILSIFTPAMKAPDRYFVDVK